jgi:endoglucanase
MRRISGFLLLLFVFPACLHAQGFLHAKGKYIYDGAGNEIILRGIGTGNWMLQEGYMMQSSQIAGTQHEFRAKLTETIGAAKTDSFYNAWLAYHFTRADVHAMKSWGFNSIRVALHYKWFTLPVEEEPVEGENTWLEQGFDLLDSLLRWCGDHEMYLILDLHGAPGGQGKDANISDYDETKPSLWESEANKNKTVALWRRLAERYSHEPWIGGYDLINETNWPFKEPDNAPMLALFRELTKAIREVDTSHIIILGGNGWGNDYKGLTPPWDDNMVYSFHKYWSYNTPKVINYITTLRDTYNVPIWLGESGENSNTWFTNCISLCESMHIGWSWWPVKKPGNNNPLKVRVNSDYEALIESWEGKGKGKALTEQEAYNAVMQFASNHKFENCEFHPDVVDAMIRQPHSTETLPFKPHTIGKAVFACDYDLGRNGYAYSDFDTANYHQSEFGRHTTWNHGHCYRNDGVDIGECDDTEETNGYQVGWTTEGEWLLFTVNAEETTKCTLRIRYATDGNNTVVHLEIDGKPAGASIALPSTGGWQQWATFEAGELTFPAGAHKVKFCFDQGSINLNYFKLTASE